MEGADAVRYIQIILLLLLCNDIDGTAQCICSQAGSDGEVEVRANPAFLSHLDARCTVHQVVEVI